jgi:hypothetical protein
MYSNPSPHGKVLKRVGYLTSNSQSASLSWCQATIRACDQFFFLLEIFLRQLRVCYFMAPSLTRGRDYNLLLLLGLASTVPLRSESCRTQDHTLLSQFLRLYQTWRARCPYLDPPGTGWPSYQACVIMDLIRALWRVNLLLVLNRSLLNKKYNLINQNKCAVFFIHWAVSFWKLIKFDLSFSLS